MVCEGRGVKGGVYREGCEGTGCEGTGGAVGSGARAHGGRAAESTTVEIVREPMYMQEGTEDEVSTIRHD